MASRRGRGQALFAALEKKKAEKVHQDENRIEQEMSLLGNNLKTKLFGTLWNNVKIKM